MAGGKGLLENQGLGRGLEVGLPTFFLSAYPWIFLFHKLERAPHFRWSAPQHSKTMTTVPTMLGKALSSTQWHAKGMHGRGSYPRLSEGGLQSGNVLPSRGYQSFTLKER